MCLAGFEERCGLHTAVDQHCQFINSKKHLSCLCTWAFHEIEKEKENERDRMKEEKEGEMEGRRKREREKEEKGRERCREIILFVFLKWHSYR